MDDSGGNSRMKATFSFDLEGEDIECRAVAFALASNLDVAVKLANKVAERIQSGAKIVDWRLEKIDEST